MVTYDELEKDLNISGTTNRSFLQSLINRSVSWFEGKCNRNFFARARTEYYTGDSSDTLYLKNYPFSYNVSGNLDNTCITTLQYYDEGEEEYTNLITETGDTIANSTEVFEGGKLVLIKDYTFKTATKPHNIKITYTGGYKFESGTGTVAVTAGATAVVGTSTLFTTEVDLWDCLIIGSERIPVKTITDATNIVLQDALITVASGASYKISNLPRDLVEGFIAKAKELYYESPYGDSRFGISSKGLGGQGSESTSYEKRDFKELIAKYKNINI